MSSVRHDGVSADISLWGKDLTPRPSERGAVSRGRGLFAPLNARAISRWRPSDRGVGGLTVESPVATRGSLRVAVGCLQLRATPGEPAGHSRAVGPHPGDWGHPEEARSRCALLRQREIQEAGGQYTRHTSWLQFSVGAETYGKQWGKAKKERKKEKKPHVCSPGCSGR